MLMYFGLTVHYLLAHADFYAPIARMKLVHVLLVGIGLGTSYCTLWLALINPYPTAG